MSIHDEYYAAAIPEPWTILGLRLRPLCLGHLTLLHRLESAFVTGATPSPSDLILSVLVCSQTWEDGLRMFQDDSLGDAVRQWGRQITRPTVLHRMRVRPEDRIDWSEKIAMFQDYVRLGSTTPFFIVPDGGGSGGGSNMTVVQLLRLNLHKRLGLTESEMMNRPYGLCLWDWVMLSSMDGGVQVMDKSDFDAAQQAADELGRRIRGTETPSTN